MKLNNKKTYLYSAAFTLFILLTITLWLSFKQEHLNVKLESFNQGIFEHPADIIEFNGTFWVTELLSSKVIQTNFDMSRAQHSLRHPNPKKKFSSPHHLAADENTLFFSGGWGSSIYSFNRSLSEFSEIKNKNSSKKSGLNAPHGICRQGKWLYIADSLNSRLLRIDVNSPTNSEVFTDHNQLISYGRQIICTDNDIWVSNSYEKREGLNVGKGSNVLKISDFSSGKAEIVTKFPNTNITGIYLHNDRFLFTAQWHANSISIFDIKTQKTINHLQLPPSSAGVPYGMFFSNNTNRLYISFIGDIYGKKNKGGIAVYTVENNLF